MKRMGSNPRPPGCNADRAVSELLHNVALPGVRGIGAVAVLTDLGSHSKNDPLVYAHRHGGASDSRRCAPSGRLASRGDGLGALSAAGCRTRSRPKTRAAPPKSATRRKA